MQQPIIPRAKQQPIIPRAKWRPASFAERGVTVPFTTPAVAMARLRPGEIGAAALIVANPSGADGSYVFPLRAVADFTTLSMHDRLLLDLLLALPAITPSARRRLPVLPAAPPRARPRRPPPARRRSSCSPTCC